ncbi:predicted protein [Scheffersomyces stipitis CBS 6054]|uniref:protein disulfide-isomerase n=1 Tax=Scheffersomyces stipitis (strain ATCC 58785 / CBS 6054 / NBRC 10063 / NRRL Y-11545) TaxID=322104 RepID=A3LSL2_PICST|nr:predicted protein [Scheffersomyces stipitis CBS 6054]ABN65589.2 predicted protein [Scheffersomyces stipitis CBS 6054]KAG2733586.1 hypothetical protein G9P44_003111 [Scheffersomyces stipitis]
MKFWKFSSSVLATLLAVVSVQASGPAEGDAVADPNSAVVKLTAETYKQFLDENPLVLAEYFAPWCGYCKMLGPEYAKAANSLNETNPNIKLAQIDCTEEEELCRDQGIRGYPTLKVVSNGAYADYDGPRDAAGIANYMVKQSLPAVQVPADADALTAAIEEQTKPYVIQVGASTDSDAASAYEQVAKANRNDYSFFSVEEPALVKELNTKFTNVKVTGKSPSYYVVHPGQLDDVREFEGKDINADTLTSFVTTEVVPYFGDINRDTYLTYMGSPLPLGYYFYNTAEQRAAFADEFSKLGKQYRGKINFVGLDATQFGKHAESINMDPAIVPLFAIQDTPNNKKYGVNQKENPEGPSLKTIKQFVADYLDDKLTPIVKSEDLPTEEEKKANPVVKLVGHNHNEIIEDVSKDIFVKYYAPWCGHCKKMAPIWEELASVFGSNKDDAKVVVADIDHTNNDVVLPFEIEGYPTLVLYPANGEVDEKTGLRKPVVFSGARELDAFIDFVKENGALGVDGHVLKAAQDKAAAEAAPEEEEEAAEEVKEEAAEDEDVEHDEL